MPAPRKKVINRSKKGAAIISEGESLLRERNDPV